MPVSATNWADEVDGEEQPQTFTDANGITTHIEYRINEDGKKVKITRRTQKKLIHDKVNKAVATRKKWPKFGKEKGSKPGPDPATTNVGDNIKLKLSSTGKVIEEVDEKQEAIKQQLQNKKILCRICKGDHFTTKCPYKDSLGVEDAGASTPPVEEAIPEAEQQGSKYIAPHMRAGATPKDRDAMREKRDEQPTLRVTNLSEDATEADVSELFKRFGHISRVFLARDRETNVCKGFAFVSFTMRDDAERALEAIDGRGYDNLILRVEWAKSSA
ncbi:translation initiation factor eIF3 subunit g [Lunasporangiospora selenospora]|uniref:Eukaryotic translation initiation factor 3 subunit G n=1 Tax=Lunasporangiospora selenospora TaxID=979761 RepID=A0A9P6FYG3_9FUNG|nr:translation initiation factor eIF3 subunit g [Lunasporangiospora selenospora]